MIKFIPEAKLLRDGVVFEAKDVIVLEGLHGGDLSFHLSVYGKLSD
jgi:hypothetical protein